MLLFSLLILSAPAPTLTQTLATSSTRIELRWTSSSTAAFNVLRSASASLSPSTRVAVPAGTLTYAHTGLTPATTYWYQVKSTDSVFCAAAAETTMPGSLAATTIIPGTLDLTWVGNEANPNVTGYTLQYATSANMSGAVYQFAGNVTSYRLKGLEPGRTYYVKVKAEGTTDTLDSPFSPAINVGTQAGGFFGNNAWMPAYVGGLRKYGKLELKLCGARYVAGAVCEPAEIAESGVQMMRYGGNTVDRDYSDTVSAGEYLTMVDNMRANGIEPILQVPYFAGLHNDEQVAANLVDFINHVNDRGVRYWSIGNEPDKKAYADAFYTATNVAEYTKRFSRAMKAVDPTILIVGPDIAEYRNDWLRELLGGGDANNDISGDIDLVTFHTYPFDGSANDRQRVLDSPVGTFQANLDLLKGLIGVRNLSIAVTEFNVAWQETALAELSPSAFLAGQFMAEMFGVGMKNDLAFMNFWSVVEGGESLGYIKSDGTKKSTYWHFQMLATNLRGRYGNGTSNTANVKAYATIATDQIAVAVLNQTKGALDYKLRLDNSAITTGNPVRLNLDAGKARDYSNRLEAEETQVLIFDQNGNYLRGQRYKNGDAAPSAL